MEGARLVERARPIRATAGAVRTARAEGSGRARISLKNGRVTDENDAPPPLPPAPPPALPPKLKNIWQQGWSSIFEASWLQTPVLIGERVALVKAVKVEGRETI